MMPHMKKRLFLLIFAVVSVLAPVSSVRAQEEPVVVDGRLQGYIDQKGAPVTVQMDPTSTAVIWLTTAFLGLIALGFMFMNAKRTHLD